MEATKRILFNTAAQYVRTIVNTLLTLFSTRIILATLGESDFGIYSVIASMVMMMSFITSSLAASTQRFLSYSWGKNDITEVRRIFCNSMALHLAIAVAIAVVMLPLAQPLIHNYLRILPERLEAASFVYYMVLVILIVSFITAPIRALFIARENIVYVSVIEIADAFIKLGGAISLTYLTWDSLKAYGLLMAFIAIVTFLAYLLYAMKYYEECTFPKSNDISRNKIREMSGFATWTVYSVGSTVIRTQGLAIIINRFLGTILNASYGIALQINNSISAVAISVINAMNPQLMKAEGCGKRSEMLKLATLESKYSFLIMSLLLLPVVIELPAILSFWLGKIPESATAFSTLMILAFVFDQSTIGLTSANQAVGKIRNYSLLISTIKLMVLPASWLCLYVGKPAESVMVVFLIIEVICGLIRIPFLKYTAGLDVRDYCHTVYVRTFVPILANIITAFAIARTMEFAGRFVLTEAAAILLSLPFVYRFALTESERQWILIRIKNKIPSA